MKYIQLIALALVIGTFSASAVDITLTMPGTLAQKNISTSTTDLVVSGTLDASDLYFIGDKLAELTTLDLSGAKIAAYDGDLLHQHYTYPASTLPAGVFAGMKLKKLVLPNTSLTISDGALAGTQLTDIDLSRTDSIGQGAFADCRALTEITLYTDRLGSHAFAGCTALNRADLSRLSRVPAYTFSRCAALTDVVTDNISAIGQSAFRGCSALSTFNFGSRLSTLEASAFEMSGLVTADLSASTRLTRLGDRSFAECESLTEVMLPLTLTDLGQATFLHDKSLTAIEIPEGVSTLDHRVLKGAGLTGSITIANGVTAIGSYALKDMSGITDIKLPGSLESIGDGAMENMTGLTHIDATDLDTPPALGKEVWRGVDQPNVTVDVVEAASAPFADADQWRDFHFNVTSGVNSVLPDGAGDIAPLKARFAGTDLEVSIAGTNITDIVLYDPMGRQLVHVTPDSDLVVIDTADMGTNIFILNARLEDGRTASLKLARR